MQRFAEKPAVGPTVSGGFFVFQRRFLDYLSEDKCCVLEKQPLERLAEDGQLVAYQHPGFWYAMDTYREFLYLNQLWDTDQAPWKPEYGKP